jgi:outer membrane receptor protein involved in Fe transport
VENLFRFAHGSGGARATHQLLVTADYRRDQEDLDSTVTDYDIFSYVDGSSSKLLLGFLPVGQGLIYKYVATTDATQTDYGVAVQDLIAIGQRVNVLAGLRFESNHIDTVRKGTEQVTAAFGGPLVSLDSAPPVSKTSSVAPRLGVVFKATPRLSLFASYLTAFISPVPGLLTKAGATLDAEHSRQLEGGVKATLRDERIFVTTSVYKTLKDDSFVFYPGYAENEGREESSGFEVELMGALTSEVSLIAGYTYTDMAFTKSSPELTGKTRPGVPTHAFSSWVRYQPSDSRVRGLSLGAGVTSTGRVWASFPNSAALPKVTTVDALVGYERRQWRLQLNGTNLTGALGYNPSGGFFAGGDPHVNPMSAVPTAGRRLTTHLSFRF